MYCVLFCIFCRGCILQGWSHFLNLHFCLLFYFCFLLLFLCQANIETFLADACVLTPYIYYQDCLNYVKAIPDMIKLFAQEYLVSTIWTFPTPKWPDQYENQIKGPPCFQISQKKAKLCKNKRRKTVHSEFSL